MPIETVSGILRKSQENKCGVAAFNVFNYESIQWVLEVAQEENTPVILQFHPAMSQYISISAVAALARELAKDSTIPVGLHLDHSPSFEIAMQGIKAGFPSVMIDASALPFAENVKLTKRVVEMARLFDVEVEAELGLVGRAEKKEDFLDADKYTKVGAAVAFLEETCVDSLAVSIGNSHGQYVCEPHLDIQRLDEIHRAVGCPLVLHGGSGIPKQQVQQAILHGITKVNIATELGLAFQTQIKAAVDSPLSQKLAVLGTMMTARPQVKEFIRQKIKMLQPSQDLL